MGHSELLALVDWVESDRVPRPESEHQAHELIQEASRQRVAPLLYTAVAREVEHWPEPTLDRLRNLHHTSFVRTVQALQTAVDVAERLNRAGLRTLPLKGAALAEHFYESPGERPMDDVDLLALDDWRESVRTLTEAGLEETMRADHAWSFRDPRTGVSVELHHSVTSCPGFYPFEVEGLWQRSVVRSGSLVARRPSNEDLLVQLALHAAFQHGLVLRLIQYVDFRRLWSVADLSPSRLQARLDESASPWAYAAASRAAAAILGPESVPEALGPTPRLTGWLEGWLARGENDPTLFLSPSQPPIARLRWELAVGRRLELVARSVASGPPGERPPGIARTIGRGAVLAMKWGPQVVRSWCGMR